MEQGRDPAISRPSAFAALRRRALSCKNPPFCPRARPPREGAASPDEAIEKWLQKNFDSIFQNELNNWHTDEKDWVQKRTYKLFKEWFDIEIHSMILDMEDSVIKKE